MNEQVLIAQVLDTWKVHNDINLYLIGEIPTAGFKAVPAGSKGRTVAEQLFHMNRVRLGWLEFHVTGKRPKLPRAKDANPTRSKLKNLLADPAKRWEIFL